MGKGWGGEVYVKGLGFICIRTEEGVVVYVKGREWELVNLYRGGSGRCYICVGAGVGGVVYL